MSATLNTSSSAGAADDLRRIRVAAAVVWHEDRVLLTQRPPGGPIGLLWEFPGGKIEPGETHEVALVREIQEELGVKATPIEKVGDVTHITEEGVTIEITFVHCELNSRNFELSPAVHSIQWVRPSEMNLDVVLPADRDFLRSLESPGLGASDGESRNR